MSYKVYVGPMFSGKSERLYSEFKKEVYGKTGVFFRITLEEMQQPEEVEVVSHGGVYYRVLRVSPESFPKVVTGDVVAVDEVQFLSEWTVELFFQWHLEGKEVLVAGLDLDFSMMPFRSVARALCYATEAVKLAAKCVYCYRVAHYSMRKTDSLETFLEGGSEIYEPVCHDCYKERKSDINCSG